MAKMTLNSIKKYKNSQKLTVITAYDALFASIFDKHIDIILVGDSLNNSFNGKNDTLSVTLDQMIYHTKAVCAGAKESFIITDMPFGTYNNKKEALTNSVKVYKETETDAVKIEGGVERAKIVRHLTDNSIAVVGHIGLMPQFVRSEGGYKVRGKTEEDAQKLIEDAKAIEKAGACMIVIEGVVAEVAKKITEAVEIPTIGIGAGADTDGQVLVWSDMFGFYDKHIPKFVRKFIDGKNLLEEGLLQYVSDVKSKNFPNKDESY